MHTHTHTGWWVVLFRIRRKRKAVRVMYRHTPNTHTCTLVNTHFLTPTQPHLQTHTRTHTRSNRYLWQSKGRGPFYLLVCVSLYVCVTYECMCVGRYVLSRCVCVLVCVRLPCLAKYIYAHICNACAYMCVHVCVRRSGGHVSAPGSSPPALLPPGQPTGQGETQHITHMQHA